MKTFCAFGLWLLALPAAAITVDIHIGEARVQGGRADDVALRLQSGADKDWRNWSLAVEAPAVRYQAQTVRRPRFAAALAWRDGEWHIDEATIHGGFLDTQWRLSSEAVQLSRLLAGDVAWPEGMHVELREDQGALQAQFGANKGRLQARIPGKRLSAWLKAVGLDWPEAQGMVLSTLSLGQQAGRWQLQGEVNIADGTWSSADARLALEKAGGTLAFSAQGVNGQWTGHFDLQFNSGEALFSPLYFNLGETPLSLSGQWSLKGGRLAVEEVHFVEREIHGELAALLDWPALTPLRLQVHQASGAADAIYRRYLQAFLADTLFADATLAGSLFVTLDWRQEGLQEMAAIFHRVDVVDNQGRFALRGLDGQLGRGSHSEIRLADSMWRRLPIGAWQAEFQWREDGVHLLAPLRVPVLDGALVIERLEPQGANDYRLDMRIDPVDLRKFSEALDLPHFDGEVSGNFRQVRLNREGLRLLEPVFVRVFGGQVRVNDLRIERLFTAQPLLYFGLDIDRLDLQRLTKVMQIAEIQGNISGKVQDVQLLNWEIKRFAADIHTSADEPGKRLISHEAVQYLSAAGGGSAMVGEFVRMLNAFPYARLGFSATLASNVLTMGGVEDADDGGYYLVKGQGLPHLDIIGYERRVNWPELLRRLDAARHSGSAVVE